MLNDSNPKKLTGAGTTTIGACLQFGVCINKTLIGTLDIKESGTSVAQFAIGTVPGTYHLAANGVRYSLLTYVLSAADDVTALTRVF